MASAFMNIMKGGKLPVLSIITSIICAVAFVVLLYSETFTSLSPHSILKLRTCPKNSSSNKFTTDSSKPDETSMADDLDGKERKLEFDPDICDVYDGKWVFNASAKPLYSDTTCPYVDKQFSCKKNGRPDSDYYKWEWHPDECRLPRFDPELALKRLRGKRLMFVGDSLIRNQWESFVCMVQWIIPDEDHQKSMKSGRVHSVFRAKEYNATVEFYWDPFLVESNSDRRIVVDPKKRIIKVDSIEKHAKHWEGVDILVFGTYVWWMSGLKIKSLWGSFANGEEGYEELETPVAYRIGLKTWANWVDSTIDTNKTRVFFTTMSPTHSRSLDWGGKDGMKCFNETRPILKKGFWGTGSNKQLMKAVVEVVDQMKVPVTFINVTQISEYRIDGHASVYSETGGKLLTEEQREDPSNADCIHWCLPGVPDTWNRIFFTHL